MDFNVKDLQNKGMEAVNAVTSGVETIANNTVNDIGKILGHVSDCAAQMDQIRILSMHRAIQYHSTMMQIMNKNDIINIEVIEKVFVKIFENLPQVPPPRLLKLHNPEHAVWGTENYKITSVDILNEEINPDNKPYFFVHGMLSKAEDGSAFNFYKQFEKEARMFQNDTNANYSKTDIYLVSYDTDLTDELKLLIRRGIESVLEGSVTGEDAENIYLAILWQELVSRAKDAGNMLVPFLRRLIRMDKPNLLSGKAISHSLGNVVIATAAKEIHFPVVEAWWCMAAALPSNAFTNTGDYAISPIIAGYPESGNQGTIVWFSRMDEVLSYVFPLANKKSMALGVTGALEHDQPLTNLDVTACSLLTHAGPDGYFRLLGESIRSRLGTELFPELFCEKVWAP